MTLAAVAIALTAASALVVVLPDGAAAQSAPAALHNKTVVLSWSEFRVQKADAGDIARSNTRSDFRVFISGGGRLFSRFTRQNPKSGRSNSSALGPDGKMSVSGVGQGSRSARFDGQQLVSENSMSSGARRIQADFGAGFRSCSLRVIYGKQNGADQRHRGMDGRMYTIISTAVSAQSCTIRDGNLVGDS
jgi:hypothetical protein